MPTAKASILVAIAAGIITVKPKAPLVPLHSPFRFSRIMLIPIMHRRNRATIFRNRLNILANCSSADISERRHKRLKQPKYIPAISPAFAGCFLVFKPLQTETAKASIDNPTATSKDQAAPSVSPPLPASTYAPLQSISLLFPAPEPFHSNGLFSQAAPHGFPFLQYAPDLTE